MPGRVPNAVRLSFWTVEVAGLRILAFGGSRGGLQTSSTRRSCVVDVLVQRSWRGKFSGWKSFTACQQSSSIKYSLTHNSHCFPVAFPQHCPPYLAPQSQFGSKVDVNRFCLRVSIKCIRSQLAADARRLVASKRDTEMRITGRVDPDHSGL